MPDYDTYLSPFSWRYAGPEMRRLWSENTKRLLWRKIWVALARAQSEFGLVTPAQVAELEANAGRIDLERALQIEGEIHHDLMAEVRTFAEQCPQAGGIIHLGATSMDVEDNADALRLRQATGLVLESLAGLLRAFATRIQATAGLPIMSFTHLQPAEPSTLGYRLAFTAQDLLADYQELSRQRELINGKGFKGAVGTAASYIELLGLQGYQHFEARLSELLDLPFFAVATQTYPRRQEYHLLSALAGLGGTLYKFAFDLRLLQSPTIGELNEPFGSRQVGSSAMPFKRNPINAEKIDSLARALAAMPQIAWGNAAHSLLERTLDDSANRRTLLPEAFLITDELLRTATRLVNGLRINEDTIRRNFAIYAPFAGTERLMMALVKAGADRQEMHERLRDHAMQAWQVVQQGQPNPLIPALAADLAFQAYLPPKQIQSLLVVEDYTGIATQRALDTAANILKALPV
ncbi:MAG: adenylosuccinate lyase [Anaerolineaceae bacterium]|nr:adenylosuccinate lyase [Anaerolineaceae bacterium]